MLFFDNAVVDFARKLPPDMAHRGNREKYVLSLFRGQLRGAVARRRKQPRAAPDRRYYRVPLRAYAREVLLDAPVDGPLNLSVVKKRFSGWLESSDIYLRRLRALLASRLW